MRQVVREGTGTAAALEGVEVAGKTGTAELNLTGPQPAVVHGLRRRRRRRRDAGAVPGRHGRHRRRADRRAACSRRWGSRCRSSRATRWSTAATASSAGSAPAGWPRSTAPRTSSSAARSRSSSCTAASPRTTSSSSASAARPRPPPACSTRTSSRSSTAARWDGTYYIAMEFLPGRSLKQIVHDHGALEPDLAADLTIQILQAARFAHRRGVVHRDLKPQNVIVDDEGRAKVADFGIARAGASDMTETGSVMGTAQYLSPEQAQGAARRRPLRPLLDRRRPLRAAHRRGPVRRRVAGDRRPQAGLRGAGPGDPAQSGHPARTRRGRDACACARTRTRASRTRTSSSPRSSGRSPAATSSSASSRSPWSRTTAGRSGAIAALVILALAAIAVGAYLLLRSETKPVPNVVDKRAENATQILQREGFEVNIVPLQSDTVEEDRVAGQDPAPGEDAEVGSEVTINVSTGPGEALVPLVQGLPVDEATDQMRDAGFRTERSNEYSDTVKKNRVIETSPAEGESVRKGSTVTLVVSRGKEKTAIPDVVGQPQDQARGGAGRRRLPGGHAGAGGRGRGARHRARAGSAGRHAGRRGHAGHADRRHGARAGRGARRGRGGARRRPAGARGGGLHGPRGRRARRHARRGRLRHRPGPGRGRAGRARLAA